LHFAGRTINSNYIFRKNHGYPSFLDIPLSSAILIFILYLHIRFLDERSILIIVIRAQHGRRCITARADKTILLVDDNPELLSSFQAALQNIGYHTITKETSQAALSVLDQGAVVDLVITDYMMPGMDGLEFLAALRRRSLSIPVIMMTARGNMDIYIKALNLGAYEFLNKPVSIKDLNAIVTSALNATA
jgi:CheY-like chemotaxis protein